MEPRQREPEGSYTIDTDGARRLCKCIIVRALRDLGSGLPVEQNKVWAWVESGRFEEMCIWAGWGDGWMMDLFSSVHHLGPSVKKEITRDCVKMLKRFGKIA